MQFYIYNNNISSKRKEKGSIDPRKKFVIILRQHLIYEWLMEVLLFGPWPKILVLFNASKHIAEALVRNGGGRRVIGPREELREIRGGGDGANRGWENGGAFVALKRKEGSVC